MKNTITVELTYKELRIVRRALSSRSSILYDRTTASATETGRRLAQIEEDIVDNLFERLSDNIEEYERDNDVPATFTELLEQEEED